MSQKGPGSGQRLYLSDSSWVSRGSRGSRGEAGSPILSQHLTPRSPGVMCDIGRCIMWLQFFIWTPESRADSHVPCGIEEGLPPEGSGCSAGISPRDQGPPSLTKDTRGHSESLRDQDSFPHIPFSHNRPVRLQMLVSLTRFLRAVVTGAPLVSGSAPSFSARKGLSQGERIMHMNAIPCSACNHCPPARSCPHAHFTDVKTETHCRVTITNEEQSPS